MLGSLAFLLVDLLFPITLVGAYALFNKASASNSSSIAPVSEVLILSNDPFELSKSNACPSPPPKLSSLS